MPDSTAEQPAPIARASSSRKSTFGSILGMLVLCVVIATASFIAGGLEATNAFWKQAKDRGLAWHSRQTGELQWKTGEELALTVMANGDALKLERAIMVLRDPLPDGWNTKVDVTKTPPIDKPLWEYSIENRTSAEIRADEAKKRKP